MHYKTNITQLTYSLMSHVNILSHKMQQMYLLVRNDKKR